MSADVVPRNLRVLVVDDTLPIHEDFRNILGMPGEQEDQLARAAKALFDFPAPTTGEALRFEIDSAFQGQEALAAVERALGLGLPYAMAFVDVRMPPGWDGIETVVKLWAVQPDLQIVTICRRTDVDGRRRGHD